jgi:hypothetical protein
VRLLPELERQCFEGACTPPGHQPAHPAHVEQETPPCMLAVGRAGLE